MHAFSCRNFKEMQMHFRPEQRDFRSSVSAVTPEDVSITIIAHYAPPPPLRGVALCDRGQSYAELLLHNSFKTLFRGLAECHGPGSSRHSKNGITKETFLLSLARLFEQM